MTGREDMERRPVLSMLVALVLTATLGCAAPKQAQAPPAPPTS